MEPLKDPVGDRVVASHPPPPARPLSDELLYPDGNKKKPDCDQLRKHCLREGTLTKEMLLDIIERVTEVFKGEPTLVRCLRLKFVNGGDLSIRNSINITMTLMKIFIAE
jgi:serine/threonine-protein phosphatase 2B catalytic subunit